MKENGPSRKSPSIALRPVPEFDPTLLPEVLRPWIVDIVERTQCPVDFPAVGAMVALASIVGRRLGIRPKQRDDWLVIPNLWGVLVGRPGVMKSPPLKEVLRPLKRLEIRAAEDHARAMQRHNADLLLASARKKAAEAVLRKAIQDGGDDPREIAARMADEEPTAPPRRRFIVNDATVEKLGVILNENPWSVLNYRDELLGLLKALEKPGQECARAFYLECWEGNGRFTYDRIGRGTLDILACCLSIIGTIQPGPLHSYLSALLAGGAGDDGLLQRFQLAVWPDVGGEWRNVDRWPDGAAKSAAYDLFVHLADLDPRELGAIQDDDHSDGVPYLRFGPDAQAAFDEWRRDLEKAVRAGTLPPALESVFAKYRSLIPSLALLTHVADGGRGPVAVTALDKAIGWARHLVVRPASVY